MFEMGLDVYQDDLEVFKKATSSPEDLVEHLSYMLSDARRKTEVSLKNLTADERKLMEEAKDKEVDQWISNSVFKIVRKSGVPLSRIMAMRWILTWKEAPEGTKAKARLVAKGFTDPDLLTIRAEAPTLSKIGRHLLLQLNCSNKFKMEVGDVSTAFLQGDKKEQDRDVYLEPTADLRTRLGIDQSSILKLTGSVYGLRNAPRAWYKRVRADLESQGWRVHQLDQCIFMLYEKGDIIGTCGVYVDDFIVAGRTNDPRWRKAKEKLKGLYKWGKWERDSFTLCGVRYLQKSDYSVQMDQQDFVRKLHQADFQVPKNLHKMNGKSKLDAHGLKALRGINGSLQWLVSNTRVDLAAKVSLSASETANPTIASLQRANKLIRQAQHHETLPVHIHAISMDKLNFGIFSDAAWGVRPDGSSQGGFLIYATSHDLHRGEEAPLGIIEWKSWKLTRKCRSSLSAESQAMADSVDMLNFVRLFFADFLHAEGVDLRRPDEILRLLPESCAITDCKSLYDALEKNESLGLGLSEKRTSIEVMATRQQMRATGIKTRWVNSDRQLADVLTKATAPPASILKLQTTGRWKIVWDENYTSAKNLRKAKRDAHFKTVHGRHHVSKGNE